MCVCLSLCVRVAVAFPDSHFTHRHSLLSHSLHNNIMPTRTLLFAAVVVVVVVLASAAVATSSSVSSEQQHEVEVLLPTPAAGSVAERAEAMLLGALVADAAAMPLHWIYDVRKIAELTHGKRPEFFVPPSCPFYNYSEGENSPYGQQTSVYLNVVSTSGTIDPRALEKAYYDFYTTGKCGQGSGCYQDGSTKGFVKNVAEGKHWTLCGADDTQADAMPHAMIVVALMAGHPKMLETCGTIIRVTQNTEKAVAYGTAYARIMEKIVLGSATSGLDAVQAAIKELEDPSRCCKTLYDAELARGLRNYTNAENLRRPNIDVVLEVGQSCDWPFNLWGGGHLIAQGADFANATTQTIRAGGDMCSRNMYVQGFNAARQGAAAIPQEWRNKTGAFNTYQQQARLLVSKRPAYLPK